jgi:hypothetical protein
LYVDHNTPGLREELADKIDVTQVDVQVVKTPLITRTKSVQESIADTRKDFHKHLGLI